MVEETRRFFRRRMLQTWVEKKDPETGPAVGPVGKTKKMIDLIDTGALRRSMLNPSAVRPALGRNALWFSPDAPPYAEHVQARYGFMPADRQMLDYRRGRLLVGAGDDVLCQFACFSSLGCLGYGPRRRDERWRRWYAFAFLRVHLS